MKPLPAILLLLATVAAGCGGPRMLVTTGTQLGIHASPGDGNTTPPSAVVGYKRAEMALIPTARTRSRNDTNDPAGNNDTFSSLGVFDLQTSFFGETTIEQFIATGHAARNLEAAGSRFPAAFSGAGDTSAREMERLQDEVVRHLAPLSDADQATTAESLLKSIGMTSTTPVWTLHEKLSSDLERVQREALAARLKRLK